MSMDDITAVLMNILATRLHSAKTMAAKHDDARQEWVPLPDLVAFLVLAVGPRFVGDPNLRAMLLRPSVSRLLAHQVLSMFCFFD